jgi:hypothetical protein
MLLFLAPLLQKISAGRRLQRELQIKFSRIRNVSWQGGGLIVNIELVAFNPTNTPFYLQSLTGDLFFNSEVLAVGNLLSPTNLSPGNSYIQLTFNVAPGAAGNAIYNIATGLGGSMNLRFVGSAQVDNFSVPVDEKFSI